MSNYLSRRGGRFFARLRIPRSLQAAYGGKPDLRVSLDTADPRQARQRVLETVLRWKRDFARLQSMLDARKLVAGSPLLLGDGLIALESAARECGLPVEEMFREAVNRAVELRIEAGGWLGTDIASTSLVFEYDHGDAVVGDQVYVVEVLDVGASIDGRQQTPIMGNLFFRCESFPLIDSGVFTDCLFFRDAERSRAVVVPLPGATVAIGAMLIAKPDAESLRAAVAMRVTPAMIEAAETRAPAQPQPQPLASHKYGQMRASALLESFFKAKVEVWSAATKIQTPPMCLVFVELMGDPVLADIDGAMMLRYREALMTLPAHLPRARRRLRVQRLTDLVAGSMGMPTMPGSRADDYVTKLSEALKWAFNRGFMPINPAAGIVGRKKKTKRQQDDRQEFTRENLNLIFSAPWYTTGKGTKSTSGLYRTFYPAMFWAPLLALYTGGRLNELAQLDLADVRLTPGGTWFLHVVVGKLDEINGNDKRLKTVNAEREVPLHPELLRLGFVDYVLALRKVNHKKLFPELTYDRIKGYGKAVGAWFDERFMGKQLQIPRDGKQSFHSFRHNFVNALSHLKPPIGEFTVNQLSGHERGDTTSGNRYVKDEGPDVLHLHVDRLDFDLPPIAPFDIVEGLVAVQHALDRKTKSP